LPVWEIEYSIPVHFCLNKVAGFSNLAAMDALPPANLDPLDPLVRQVVDFFVDGVRVLGLPRSIGEIYGLLFISQAALSLDDLVQQLGISKGSASQGLRTLKSLGAVREVERGAERRTYYEPAVELKRLVGGFIREQIRPHLQSGQSKITRLAATAREVTDPAQQKFLSERVERLQGWLKSGSRVLPLVQRILGQ
jgi:HTH-type transcriptional regulator, glycine betaine synthesis regulator